MWYVNNFVNSFFVLVFFIILIVNVFFFFSFPSPLFHALRHCIRKNLKVKNVMHFINFTLQLLNLKLVSAIFLKLKMHQV